MLGAYFATEHGVFEAEPIGIAELRAQKEAGEAQWIPGQVAWLKLDGTHIDYPIMQGSDNTWYLSHDYYDNSAASGAVFLDYRNSSDFSNEVSVIYGHRMNGNLMFSDVAKYRDANYFSAHVTGELITPNRSYSLRVVAYREISADDELYRDLTMRDFDGPLIILSTCDRANRGQRDILVLTFDNRGELW